MKKRKEESKTDKQLIKDILVRLKRIELKVEEISNNPRTLRPNTLASGFPEKIYYKEKSETWDKKRQEFEEIAEEISRENDFFILHDNAEREKWVKKNYPRQKQIKELIKRIFEIYRSRIRVHH